MKKAMLCLLWLCMASLASGTTIMFVNDDDVTGVNTAGEQVLIDLLVADGYDVIVSQDIEGNYFQTLDETKIGELNAVDLVIISQRISYNQYDEGTEEAQWNALTAPMLNLRTRVIRDNRWDWMPLRGDVARVAVMEAVVPDHPVFEGVRLDENNQVSVENSATVFMTTTSTGNGTLLAKEISNGYPWIVTWEKDQAYYDGATEGAAGGPRMFLAMSMIDDLDLTGDGLLLFANAVYFMSGATHDRAPTVGAGSDRVLYVGDTIQLGGFAYDPEGSATPTWSVLSGPGNANISDTGISDPTVAPDTKGIYELEMSADDGVNDPVTDTLILYVKDHANDILLAHWDFETIVDGNSFPDVTGNGFKAVFWPDPDDPAVPSGVTEPNVAPGHITGSLQAVDFTPQTFAFSVLEPFREADPNFNAVRFGSTVAIWIKVAAGNTGNNNRIIGGPGWNLRTQNNGTVIRFQGADGPNQESHAINDGYWHHYVGIFDPAAGLKTFYVDGVKAAEDPTTTGILGPSASGVVAIGSGNTGDTPPNAMVDDLQIYTYTLNEGEIAALAGAGDRILHVDVGPNVEFIRGPDPLALEPTVIDDGSPAATYTWEKVSSAPDAEATVTFTPADAANTQVDFSKGGTFVLRLTADDGIAPASDEITVTVINPTCQDVIDGGLLLLGDISGPLGVPDCNVDWYDVMVIASYWAGCNDPEDETGVCDWAW